MQFIGALEENLRFFGAIRAKPPERAADAAAVLRAEHQVRTVGRPHRPLIPEGLERHAGWPPAFHEVRAGVVYKDGNVTVTAFPTKHAMESFASKYHTSTAQLAELATQAKPRLLILYHHAIALRPDVNPGASSSAELLREVYARYSGHVVVGRDLEVY